MVLICTMISMVSYIDTIVAINFDRKRCCQFCNTTKYWKRGNFVYNFILFCFGCSQCLLIGRLSMTISNTNKKYKIIQCYWLIENEKWINEKNPSIARFHNYLVHCVPEGRGRRALRRRKTIKNSNEIKKKQKRKNQKLCCL